jgi:hypothetical protein
MGPAALCMIKGDDITLSDSRRLCRLRINDAWAPPRRSHGYSNPLDQWAVCRFLGGKRISDHCWPVTAIYTTRQKLTLCQMAQHPNLAPSQQWLHDFPLWPDVFYSHPLGSASLCTRYGSARKRTYSNQPIFLFPKQNGRRFDWRPSGVGVSRCSARSV